MWGGIMNWSDHLDTSWAEPQMAPAHQGRESEVFKGLGGFFWAENSL